MLSDSDLYESLDSALTALGVTTHDLVLSVIESRGIMFRPGRVDMKAVDGVLIELFGIGSNAIVDLACRRLDSKLLIGFDETRVPDPVEKIRIWLEVNRSRDKTIG